MVVPVECPGVRVGGFDEVDLRPAGVAAVGEDAEPRVVQDEQLRIPFTLGTVGHFGLAVRNPKRSAQWFERALGLKKQFDFEDGIAVGNDYVTIALFKGRPSPETIGHMSFHLPDMAALRRALKHLKSIEADLEDPGDEIGRRPRARRTWAFGYTTRTAIAGSFLCRIAGSNLCEASCLTSKKAFHLLECGKLHSRPFSSLSVNERIGKPQFHITGKPEIK